MGSSVCKLQSMKQFLFLAVFSVLVSVQAIASAVQITGLRVSGKHMVTALQATSQQRVVCLGKRLAVFNRQLKLQKIWPLTMPCQFFWVAADGRQAVIVHDQRLEIWSLVTGRQQFGLKVKGFSGGGFLGTKEFILATSQGIETLNLLSQKRQVLSTIQAKQFFVSPNGQTALVATAQQVQLVGLPHFKPLSATQCKGKCHVQNAQFSPSGQRVVAHLGSELWSFRAGYPSSAILRNVDHARGIPQENGTVMTLHKGQMEQRDAQTGRREKVLFKGLDTRFGMMTPDQRLLCLGQDGILQESDLSFQNTKKVTLPTQVDSGAWTQRGQLMTLSEGKLSVEAKTWSGAFWQVDTRHKVTWALQNGSDGGTQLSVLDGQRWKLTKGLRTATHLVVSHNGAYAAVWDDEKLVVVSAQTGRRKEHVVGHFAGARIALSPNGQQVFVFPQQGKAYVALVQGNGVSNFSNKKKLITQKLLKDKTSAQISGNGVLALSNDHGQQTQLYRANDKQPYAQLEGGGEEARFSPENTFLALLVSTERGWRVDIVRVGNAQKVYSSPLLAQKPSFLLWDVKNRLVIGAGLQSDLDSITILDWSKG